MDGYVPNYIEEIKRRLSIVDVIAPRINLKKSGRNYKGLCPFHGEKSPSFFVWPDSESYYCFGCKESGDIFNFLMKVDGLDFGEVVEQLAGRTGVPLPERQAETQDPETAKRKKELERLREANAAAATYFQHLLLNSKEGQLARDYLAKRSLAPATVAGFGLGYAVDSYETLLKYLTNKGFTAQELVAAGLVGERENGEGYYDRFRGRLMFPIRDRQGQIIAFGGRVLDNAPKDAPKYLNTPQTVLFDKGATLYGLDLAKDAIRRENRVVIVEGYVDVIMAHQHGYNNVVAPLGTALGEKHIGILKKLTSRVVLALDADSAGQMATLRGIEVAKQGFDSKTIAVPTARGLIRFEQQLDADVRIATLPAGKDPDEVVREGGGRWREIIERAMPVVDYYFATVGASVDINSAKGKSEAIEKLTPVILEVKDRIEREHYIQKLARLTRIEVGLIRSELSRAAKAQVQRPAPLAAEDAGEPDLTIDVGDAPTETTRPKIVAPQRPLDIEDLLLAFIVRYRSDALHAAGVDNRPVEASDFLRSENRLLFEAFLQVEVGELTLEGLEETLNPELASHLERLQLQSQAEPELNDLLGIQETMQFQLNRVREFNLRRIYEQGSRALEEVALESETETSDYSESEEQAAHDNLWRSVSEASERLKLYYPKKSSIFRDSRDR